MKFVKKIKSNTKKIIENTTVHGFPNLVSDKSLPIKLLWAISILASISFCFWFISVSFTEYFQFNVITNINMRREYSIDFPAVTFCLYSGTLRTTKNLNLTNLVECKFSAKKCDPSYMKEVKILQLGTYQKCLQFNAKIPNSDTKILKVTQTGWDYALIVTFKVPSNVYLYFSVEDNQRNVIFKNFRYLLENGKIHLKTIEKETQKTLGRPYNECIEESEQYDSKFYQQTISKFSYRRENCLDICFYENYKNICNCSLSENHDSINGNCGRNNECFKKMTKSFDFFENCHVSCPLECGGESYRIIEEAKASYSYAEKHKRTLYLFFPHLKYTEIVQIPKTTTSNLVSNIGGTFGLFLGISLLSFIEVIELIIISLVK